MPYVREKEKIKKNIFNLNQEEKKLILSFLFIFAAMFRRVGYLGSYTLQMTT